MKIAVSASKPDLSSPVDPRFGRCPYFLIVETKTMQFEAVENSNVSASSGAGIQSAQFIANKDVKALLTGSCGPNAFQTLQAAGIEVIVGVTGSVQEAIQQYKSGQFQATAKPNVPAHSGMGMGASSPKGPEFGMGGGMGRGMGGGMGRGMGQGMGRGMSPAMGYGPPPQSSGISPFGPNAPQLSPEEELPNLKHHAEILKQEMENITKRIEELEKKKTKSL